MVKGKKKILYIVIPLTIIAFIGLLSGYVDNKTSPSQPTAEAKYPGLFSSALRLAIPDSLPTGELLVSGKIKITQAQLDVDIKKLPANIQGQLKNNSFVLLEQVAIQQLIAAEAKAWAVSKKPNLKDKKEDEIIREYFKDLTSAITVTPEEIKKFYESNLWALGGAKFDDVQAQLKDYLLNDKKKTFIETHINSLGKRTIIKISDAWANAQYPKAIDNPVEKARRSGKPSFINFGATGCIPCDMMAPIREEIKKEHSGILNVEFINVNQQQILGARYGISSIPVQVFFDKNGKEVYRHVGYFAKDEILKKLKEMGVAK